MFCSLYSYWVGGTHAQSVDTAQFADGTTAARLYWNSVTAPSAGDPNIKVDNGRMVYSTSSVTYDPKHFCESKRTGKMFVTSKLYVCLFVCGTCTYGK